MGNQYWLEEQPNTVDTKHCRFAHYRNAGVLQVARLSPAGKVVKAVGMNVEELKDSPEVLDFLTDILRDKS